MNFQKNINALKTMLRRELNRTFRIWRQTLIPPLITTTLYFFIFGHLLGSRLGAVSSFSYLQFLVPGIVMMSILNNAFGATSAPVFILKFQRNFEQMLVSPMSNHIILMGFILSGVMRALLISILVMGVALLFTFLPLSHITLLITSGILAAITFSLVGTVNGLLAESFDDISWVPTFLLTPLTYLGGVFYPLTALPVFWQKVSLFNPIFYLIDIFRYGFLGLHAINPIITLSLLGSLIIVLYGCAYYLIKYSPRLRP